MLTFSVARQRHKPCEEVDEHVNKFLSCSGSHLHSQTLEHSEEQAKKTIYHVWTTTSHTAQWGTSQEDDLPRLNNHIIQSTVRNKPRRRSTMSEQPHQTQHCEEQAKKTIYHVWTTTSHTALWRTSQEDDLPCLNNHITLSTVKNKPRRRSTMSEQPHHTQHSEEQAKKTIYHVWTTTTSQQSSHKVHC